MNDLVNVDQLVALVPGTTKGYWAQLRFLGTGPRFYKPSPKVVLYKSSEVLAWIDSTARSGTAVAAS
jgi:hypothetical protein